MKYYWLASTIEIRKASHQEYAQQRKCRKGVSPDTKMCFPTTGVPQLSIICASWWLSTATMLNKVRFLMSALSLIERNMCCTAIPWNQHKFLCHIYVSFAGFKPFYVVFIDFLSHFIDHFYNIFRSSKSGSWSSQFITVVILVQSRIWSYWFIPLLFEFSSFLRR